MLRNRAADGRRHGDEVGMVSFFPRGREVRISDDSGRPGNVEPVRGCHVRRSRPRCVEVIDGLEGAGNASCRVRVGNRATTQGAS
jgi:hypothetical protein